MKAPTLEKHFGSDERYCESCQSSGVELRIYPTHSDDPKHPWIAQCHLCAKLQPDVQDPIVGAIAFVGNEILKELRKARPK